MSDLAIVPGCILHWEGFQFPDGGEANKYLVIVGVKSGRNYLAVIGTSKRHRRTFIPGAHPADGYFHIPGGGKDWFPSDTWLLVARPREISPAEFLENYFLGALRLRGTLERN